MSSQPAVAVFFQSALREKAHCSAREGMGAAGGKCQIKLFWDYLDCPFAHNLWSHYIEIADLSDFYSDSGWLAFSRVSYFTGLVAKLKLGRALFLL